jgi:hypothetical protein
MKYKITKDGYGCYRLYRRIGFFKDVGLFSLLPKWQYVGLFKSPQEAKDKVTNWDEVQREREKMGKEVAVETFTTN